MKNRIVKYLRDVLARKRDRKNKDSSNLEMLLVDVKPNEFVCFYRNGKTVGYAFGNYTLMVSYDKSFGKIHTERIYWDYGIGRVFKDFLA